MCVIALNYKVCYRIGRKKTTVIGVVVAFFASLIAVFLQRDLKNTGKINLRYFSLL